MEFSQIVLNEIGDQLKRHAFILIDIQDHSIEMQSKNGVIIVSFNKRENSKTLWMGSVINKKWMVEIDDVVLKKHFNSSFSLRSETQEEYAKKLSLFLNTIAQPFLNGDTVWMHDLERYDIKRSIDYTNELILEQKLTNADNAWNKKDYQEFIKTIDSISLDILPSYTLKYEIARKIIANNSSQQR